MRVRRVGLALLFTFLCVGTGARAQPGGAAPPAPSLDRSFDVQLFHPAVGARSFITLDGAEVLEHRLWHLGLVTSYQRQPLEYTLQDPDGSESTALVPVRNLAMAELVAAMGLRGRFEVGMALPLALTWQGDDFDRYAQGTGLRSTAAAFGDLRVEGKAALLAFGEEQNFLVSISAGGTLPTGDQGAFLGERTLTGRARAFLEYQRGEKLRAVAVVGGLLRGESRFLATSQGPAGLYGAALEVRPTSEVAVLAEVTGRYASSYVDTNPAELDLGMRFHLPSRVQVLMGGGLGLNQGLGSPMVRAFLGLGWAPDNRDRDRDGVLDREDRCPDEPEDRDGTRDDDGCPDLDNDGDGIPDAADRCPGEAEDLDRFADDDGCPEADNDGDGIVDLHDACPATREDGLGKQPSDGCPSTSEDADGDGIHDAADQCAEEPEDQDGFEDGDGCPDHDNDADGVPDLYDACPSDAEDADGFEDADGCPDPDNDHDGFPDGAERCPNQPETINYYRDDDGCPDPGTELVRLGEKDEKIHLSENINFRTGPGGQPQLTMNGNMMAALVARVLAGHVEVSKVRIEVRGKDASRELTQARAEVLKAALVKNGIDEGRLRAVGIGPGRNQVDFVIEERTRPRRRGGAMPATEPALPAPARTP